MGFVALRQLLAIVISILSTFCAGIDGWCSVVVVVGTVVEEGMEGVGFEEI
jgi:hypothetical protein